MEKKSVVIVGGGPAGLAAAIELMRKGINDILVIERENELGGILKQCIHEGFGLTRFKMPLSGPEYAQKFIDAAKSRKIVCLTGTTVLAVSSGKVVITAGRSGIRKYQAKAVILTMGCRERTRGALGIPGERPAGIFTAGTAQSYINLHNIMIGKNVVILGSGDIGMIMARRLTLEGAHVKAVFEINPYPSGLPRNIRQCLNDYNIPLYLSHTITNIHGSSRLTGVTVSRVDRQYKTIPGSEKKIECDTLILSVGLIPENDLSQDTGIELDKRTKGAVVDEYCQTDIKGIFAAGNVLHVHDVVDFVSLEAEHAADSAVAYIRNGSLPDSRISILSDKSIVYTVPQRITGENDFTLSLRVSKPLTDCEILIRQNGRTIQSKKLKKVVPAEMIHILVSKKALFESGNLEVSAR